MMATVTSANLLSPNYTTNHENEQQKLHRTASMANTDMVENDSDFEGNVTIPKFTHYTNFESSHQDSTDSEQEINTEPSTPAEISGNLPKRNKRKNFKPRCSNVSAFNSEDESTNFGADNGANSNEDSNNCDSDSNICPRTDSPNLNLEELHLVNKQYNSLGHLSNNNNLKAVRRRKTISIRHVLNPPSPKSEPNRTFPIDLSNNQKSESEGDGENSSEADESNKRNIQNVVSRNIFSIDHLSKSAQSESNSTTIRYAGTSTAMDMREYAVNTMRELLGIYGLTSEVAESISKQLPVGAFNSGKILDNLTALTPQHFPHPRLSCNINNRHRTSPPSQPPTPPHTPHTPPSNVSEQPKIPQNLPSSLQIHPLNLNSSTPNSISDRLNSVTTSASDFQKSFENSPFVRQNPQHVPQNLSLNNQQKNALNLNINNNASIKQKKSSGIYSNVNGQSTRDGGHLDQMPLSPRSAYGSYDVDQMRQKEFSKIAGASNPRGIFPSSMMMKCESLSPPPNGQDKHPMNALIAHTSSSRDSNLGSSPQNSSSSSKSGGGSGGGSSTPLDYSRYVKRFSSSLECGNLHCKDMNYREHFHCLDCVDTDISNNGPMARVFAKKEEMIRHWKWHKKRDESLQHGFMRYSPLDDCSTRYNACQHNRRQTHYHCIHDNCDKVYISTSDVQMHANYHRKDSAIIQEGFQRFRATEDCSATYCAFFGQRTTHFHCRRQGCKYTFKNKADMEKHKSYHIKDEQLSRDGFKKFMKHEQCPYDNCRFSKVCNHIHCIRPQCNYVLHSSGQLFSHKRKHERKDSELAYRKFKLAQSMMKSFQDGVTPIPLNMSQETYQHLQSNLSQEQMQQLGLSPEQLAQLSHEQMVRLGLTPDQMAQLSQHEQIMRLGLTADQIAALPPEQIARLGLTPEQFAQLTADQMARLGLTPEQVTQLTAEQMTRLGLTSEQIGQMTIEQMARLGLTPDQISPEQLARLGLTQEQLSQMTPDQLAQLNVKSEPIDQLQRMSLTPDQTGAMNLSSLHAAALNLNRDFMEQYEMLQQSSTSQMSNSGDNSDMSEGRNSPISYAESESNLAIDLSAGDQQSSDIPQNEEQPAINCVDWNNEQFWKKYCQFFSAEEKCIAKDSRICDLQFQEHYHCLVDNCCMIFNCKDGVREHARNHEQQEQVTEAFYVTVLPKQQCIEENCVYQDKEKHYHCTWDNCREVVLMSDKPFRRLDHYKMHEYSRKLSLTKDPLTMTHLATSIDGMFRRKRGRPPKNRVIEVWNDYSPIGGSSLMDSPQAIFTSFKLPKASTSTQQLNSKEQEVIDSHDEFENSSPMITDYNLQGFDVYNEDDKCPDSLCPYLGTVHYHCNQVRCLYSTDKDDILIMHSKDFHDNVDILEGFEFYDRNVDCRLPECHSNKVNRHFHCTRDSCNYSFVRYSTMAVHNQKHLTEDNCSVITSTASQNLKFEEQVPTVTVKRELPGEEVAPFETQPERVSVVKASGTYFPLSGLPSAPDTSKQITPEPALPDHPNQNSSNNSGHTLYGPELSCSRPFCKLKRKHHYHCNACNQAFSEVDRLVTHISKHSTGALNSQLGNAEDNNNQVQQPIESHHITTERHVKSPQVAVTPKPSLQKINVTPLQNLQNPPPPQPIPEIDPTNSINSAASPLGIPMYPGSPVSSTAAPALSAYGDYFGNFSSANLASQFAMISQQTGIPPQFIPQTLYQNQSLLYQMQQHGLLLSQQAAGHSILMPQSPGTSSSSDPMSPLAMMAANLNKRALSPTMSSNEMSPEQKKARIQNSMRILKDEPVPEGYVRFRFNEDCQYTHCGYREHQTHFHCQRPDCGYSFCDKTRFVQHTARHERLDTLMGGDFQQYRANVQCGRQDCAYTTTLGSTQNKASHFHCLKCDFVCTDTNKVVAHRRQHQKLDSIQAAGFEKFTPSQQCRSGNTCQHSGKQTHYHCLSCQYAVLGLAQMSAHKYRHLES